MTILNAGSQINSGYQREIRQFFPGLGIKHYCGYAHLPKDAAVAELPVYEARVHKDAPERLLTYTDEIVLGYSILLPIPIEIQSSLAISTATGGSTSAANTFVLGAGGGGNKINPTHWLYTFPENLVEATPTATPGVGGVGGAVNGLSFFSVSGTPPVVANTGMRINPVLTTQERTNLNVGRDKILIEVWTRDRQNGSAAATQGQIEELFQRVIKGL
jgi:hypothetical protein